jgi:hypothetical protein
VPRVLVSSCLTSHQNLLPRPDDCGKTVLTLFQLTTPKWKNQVPVSLRCAELSLEHGQPWEAMLRWGCATQSTQHEQEYQKLHRDPHTQRERCGYITFHKQKNMLEVTNAYPQDLRYDSSCIATRSPACRGAAEVMCSLPRMEDGGWFISARSFPALIGLKLLLASRMQRQASSCKNFFIDWH